MRARYAGTLGLLIALAVPAAAQQPPTRRAPAQPGTAAPAPQARQPNAMRMERRMEQGHSPEAILRMREQLALTEAQVARLETLRQESVTAQRNRMAERLEMRSKLRAGTITPEEVREQMQSRAGQAPAAGQQAIGERVRTVLTDQQRIRLAEQQVAQLRRQLQARQGQRGQADRGTQRGMQRGARGSMRAGADGVMTPRQGRQPGMAGAAPQRRDRMRDRVPPPVPPTQERN